MKAEQTNSLHGDFAGEPVDSVVCWLVRFLALFISKIRWGGVPGMDFWEIQILAVEYP